MDALRVTIAGHGRQANMVHNSTREVASSNEGVGGGHI
jgi:hypothetical protein